MVKSNFPISCAGILGKDFLILHECKLDFENGTIEIKNVKNEKTQILSFSTNYLIPARTEAIVQYQIESDFTEFLCPAQEIKPGIFVANSIVHKINNYAVFSIVNTTETSADLRGNCIHLEHLNNFDIFQLNKSQNEINHRLEQLEKELNLTELNDEENREILKILREFNDVFYLPGDRLSFTDAVKHKIVLHPDTQSITTRQYRLPEFTKSILNEKIPDMLKDGTIRESVSPWNSPLLVIPKKSSNGDKKWRIVIDFRKLNDVTIGDTFPLPNITEILEQLGKASYFSTMDLASGYHQISLEDSDREKTAFSTNSGHYEFNRMPFGLKNAPATFQRLMNRVLAGLNGIKCLVYLDDIVVYGYNLEEHNERLSEILSRIRQYNLKLQPGKCFFLRKEINYLGHVVTDNGVKPDPEKISCIQNYPIPRNQRELKGFLGLIGYYRRFINEFAKLSVPLNKLLKKNVKFEWNEFCDESFRKLKDKLIEPPILIFPDFQKDFYLTTDASDLALGAVLSQLVNKDDLPIAFASRTLNKAEQNYSTTHKELLAIIWGVRKFRPYLYGRKFTIVTDHKALVWLYKSKDLNSRLMRWRIELDEFEFTVVHKSGKSNCNADALSRIAIPLQRSLTDDIFVTTRHNNQASNQPIIPTNSSSNDPYLNPQPSTSRQALNEMNSELNTNTNDNVELSDLELNDDDDDDVIEVVEEDNCDILSEDESHIIHLTDEDEIHQVISDFHITPLGGHQGVLRTLNRLKRFYSFPRMRKLISDFIRSCEKCQRNKASRMNKVPMKITTTSERPFEKIFLDIVGPLPSTYQNNKYILTIQDDLSKFSIAIPLENQEADTVATAFVENYVCSYGAPQSLLTDQGTNFVSELFKNVCKLLKIKKFTATAYHPQTNGALERSHRGIGEYLRSFVDQDPLIWDQLLPYCMFAYNTTPHTTTNFMPFEILYGMKPNIPTSLQDRPADTYGYGDYIQDLKTKLRHGYARARQNAILSKERSKRYYDRNSNSTVFHVGDLVLLKRQNRTKLDSLWSGPYEVIEICSPENTKIKMDRTVKIFHNNLLKLFIE